MLAGASIRHPAWNSYPSTSLTLDLTNVPTPTGSESLMAGETRYFQMWHRDANPTPTSNFSNGLSILLQ